MRIRPSLPNITDDEVARFHPVFEYCSHIAIEELGLEDEIRIIHHQNINQITVDYSFERIGTGRIVLLAEIKRTKSAVQSTRYRHQAMSYRMAADHSAETRYFLISNLEITDLFRYDNHRPIVHSQLVSGSPYRAGNLDQEDTDDFYQRLIGCIKIILNTSINDLGEYVDGLGLLEQALKTGYQNRDQWHQYLIPASYEYIRAAINSFYPPLVNRIQQWRPADRYQDRPERLIFNGQQVDFLNIFCEPLPQINDRVAFNQDLLSQAFNSGGIRGDGEDVSAIVNGVLTVPKEGIVETDVELSRLLAILAKNSLGREIESREVISDPAAGSGRLLMAAIDLFATLLPTQIWANEIEKRFQEVLALQLGFSFAPTISATQTPRISIEDITSLSREDFLNVAIILLNPPFIRGISSSAEKDRLADKIISISGEQSKVNMGQIGLEAVFLELVWNYVANDTVIACIIPSRYLSGRSNEVKNFRDFLIGPFGLTHIMSYPRIGLFEDVVKQTIIVVGKKNVHSENVKVINSQIDVARIDLRFLADGLMNLMAEPTRGVLLDLVDNQLLVNNNANGWNYIVGAKKRAIHLQEKYFDGFRTLREVSVTSKRGSAGNSGSSDLQMLTAGSNVGGIYDLIPENWKIPAIRHADDLPKLITRLNSPNISFIPPTDAFEEGTANFNTLTRIVNGFLDLGVDRRVGVQPKARINFEKIAKALKSDLKSFPISSVLVPRGVRVGGRIGVLFEDAVVSTNFIVILFPNQDDALFTASWLSSIFGQIQMEVNGIDQEGMRKLESDQINTILVPDKSNFTHNEINELIAAFMDDDHINYKLPIVRNIDRIWLRLMHNKFGVVEEIDEIFNILLDMVDERIP